MAQMFLIFSHTVTEEQRQDAERAFQQPTLVPLPEDLQRLWSAVPPEPEEIGDWLRPLWDWLRRNAEPGDIALIQGDFGAVYAMVNAATGLGLIPVYATTARQSIETPQPDGSVRTLRIFRHVRFRRYRPFAEE